MLVILVALGITFIGVREVLYPAVCARQFGVPLPDPQDGDWLAIKAARDVVSGILAATVLGLRNRTIVTYAFRVLTLINSHWIHWETAACMLVIVELLRRGK